MKKKTNLLLLLAILIAGFDCLAAAPESNKADDQPMDYALAYPIFDAYFMCGQHMEGELEYLGDALGTDCLIARITDHDGHEFARTYEGNGAKNEDWFGWARPVLSPCECKVAKININPVVNHPGKLGKPPATFIVLEQADGIYFLLAHVTDLNVAVGESVNPGQKLGVVGNNGYARNPHIHMGAWQDGKPLQIRFDIRRKQPADQ